MLAVKQEECETTEAAEGLAKMALSPEKLIPHPLQNSWTLWFFKNDKARTWEENQRALLTVRSVEEFWSMHHHLALASRLPPGADYSLFKEGIFPDWEDERNSGGGRWLVGVDRPQRDTIDRHWLEVCMLLIGEQAGEHAHHVTGAAVNLRTKGDKLAVWLADSAAAEAVVRVGRLVKARLGLQDNQTIVFSVHKQERSKGQAKKKITYAFMPYKTRL